MATGTETKQVGRIVQVIGSTFDAEFSEDSMPAIYNAVQIQLKQGDGKVVPLVGEVNKHLGGGKVRCVALGSTEGMVRGMTVTDTGAPLSVPVGKGTLGRVFNVTGTAIDGRGDVEHDERWAIHRHPPKLEDRSAFEAKLGTSIGFSKFTKSGFWEVEDVLRPIYKEASDKLGREFPYPSDK